MNDSIWEERCQCHEESLLQVPVRIKACYVTKNSWTVASVTLTLRYHKSQ